MSEQNIVLYGKEDQVWIPFATWREDRFILSFKQAPTFDIVPGLVFNFWEQFYSVVSISDHYLLEEEYQTMTLRAKPVYVLFGCDCPEFMRLNGLTFDSEDAFRSKWIRCPCCKKSFKTFDKDTSL